MILILCVVILSTLPIIISLNGKRDIILIFSIASYAQFLMNQYGSFYLPLLLDANNNIGINNIALSALIHHSILYILFAVAIYKYVLYQNINGKNIFLELPVFNARNLAIFLTLFAVYSVYQLSNFTFTPRQSYLFGRINNGYIYILQVYLLSLTAFISVFTNISNSKRYIFIILVIFNAYMTGSKGVLFQVLIFYASIYLIRVTKINFKIFFKFSFYLIIVLMAALFISFRDQKSISDISEYLNQPYQTQRIISEAIVSNKLVFRDFEIFETEKWSYFPRYFFPEKPIFYSSALPFAIVYPEIIGVSLATPGSGEITYRFIDFGYLAPLISFIDKLIDYRFLFGIMFFLLLINKFNKYNLQFLVCFYISLPNFGVHLPIIYSSLLYYIFLILIFYLPNNRSFNGSFTK
jgi:hypothetical protein